MPNFKFVINRRTIFKALFFGILYSVVTILGDVFFFSPDKDSIVGSLVFRALGDIVMTLGIIVILLDIFDVELTSSEDDD